MSIKFKQKFVVFLVNLYITRISPLFSCIFARPQTRIKPLFLGIENGFF